jgi:dephospho-CoA kinase
MIGVNYNKNIIGLTGLYCSGKSTAQKIFEENNFTIIDVDKIGHQVLIIKQNELVDNFGSQILADNKIDRKKLGEIVFNNKVKLEKLNSIVHPVMIETVKNEIKNNPDKNICINAALLFEMELNNLCSLIFVIKASFFIIAKRSKIRDNYNFLKVSRILSKQKVLKLSKINQSSADIFYINNNNSDIDKLRININYILDKRKII